LANFKKKLTSRKERVNEMTQAEYARYKGVSAVMVNKWKKAGRLVLTADGKRILVNESNQRLKDTAHPDGYTNSIHAAARKNKDPEKESEIPLTELIKQVNESQLDLETTNADELFKNSRALKEKSSALQAAAEHEKFIGDLVSKEVVEKIVFERARQFRDGMMICKRRVAPELTGLSGITEIESVLDREFRLLLDSFSKLPVVE
jgi:hypothetical protein